MKKAVIRSAIGMVLFALLVAFAPTSARQSEAAAKKPGTVKKITTVKVTKSSIQIKYRKASGAKSYQIRVYDASDKNQKNPVKTLTAKKTTCTVKGLTPHKKYTVKVRGYNGTAYGKDISATIWTASKEGIVSSGTSTTTGKALKKEYNAWRNYVLKRAEKNKAQGIIGGVAFHLAWTEPVRCTKLIYKADSSVNQYRMEEIYKIYQTGQGSNIEKYHLLMDMLKQKGFKCEIRPASSLKGASHPTGKPSYPVLAVWTGKYTDSGSPILNTICCGSGGDTVCSYRVYLPAEEANN